MKDFDYQYVDRAFGVLFNGCRKCFSSEAQRTVDHYIDVAELELACESFVLSAIEERVQFSAETKNELLRLIVFLGLDKESSFRGDFWSVARAFLE